MTITIIQTNNVIKLMKLWSAKWVISKTVSNYFKALLLIFRQVKSLVD